MSQSHITSFFLKSQAKRKRSEPTAPTGNGNKKPKGSSTVAEDSPSNPSKKETTPTPRRSPRKAAPSSKQANPKQGKKTTRTAPRGTAVLTLGVGSSSSPSPSSSSKRTQPSSSSKRTQPPSSSKSASKRSASSSSSKRSKPAMETSTPKTQTSRKRPRASNKPRSKKTSSTTTNPSPNPTSTADDRVNAAVIEAEEAEKKMGKGFSYRAYLQRGAPPLAGIKPTPTGPKDALRGKVFLVTGVLESLDRDSAFVLIKKHGGSVAKSVTKKLTHCVVGTDPGASKMNKVEQRPDVTVIDETGLFLLIDPSYSAVAGAESPEPQETVTRFDDACHDDSTTQSRQLWADKYKPVGMSDLVGNAGPILMLKKWLSQWNPHGKEKKAALISGPPGIGKTTAVRLLCKQNGYEVLEFNASDARSKKILREHVQDATSNHSLGEFYSAGPRKNTGKPKRIALVMDEVDGMSSGDRGGLAQLAQMIKETRVPILTICNDRANRKLTTIAKYCRDIRFSRPTPRDLLPRIQRILRQEGVEYSPQDLQRVLTSVNGDVRQVLNLLQMWCGNSKVISNAEVGERLAAGKKNVDLGAFDVPGKLFDSSGKQLSINDQVSLYFVDRSMVPLLVQENIYWLHPQVLSGAAHQRPSQRDATQMALISKVADSIAAGDLVDERIGRTQAWTLAPTHAVLSCIAPAAYMRSTSASKPRLDFPKWLGKYSQTSRRYREVAELHGRTRRLASATRTELVLDYIPFWKQPLLKPLQRQGKSGIPSVIDFMDGYGITRDDWDIILEIDDLDGKEKKLKPPYGVPTTVKTAFTRQYNTSHQAQRKTSKKVANVVMKGASSAVEDEEDDEEEEEGAEAFMVKKRKKRAPATKRAAAGKKKANSKAKGKRK